MDEKQFAKLIFTLNVINANLRDVKKVLTTISNDNELIKVHMKRINTKDTSGGDIIQPPSPM